ADYITIKYNSSGEEEWVARYDRGLGDAATAIAIDSSGNVYVTGQSWSAKTSEYDCATVKYNADGQQQWVARYDGPANDYDYPTGIAVDNSENVYVTGSALGYKAIGTARRSSIIRAANNSASGAYRARWGASVWV